jgi:hypothetical protein
MVGLDLDDLAVDGPMPDQPCLHPDRGYDSTKTQDLLEVLGLRRRDRVKGVPAPIQAGKRWPVERTHSWMNGYGKLRRFTDKREIIVEFNLYLAGQDPSIAPARNPRTDSRGKRR